MHEAGTIEVRQGGRRVFGLFRSEVGAPIKAPVEIAPVVASRHDLKEGRSPIDRISLAVRETASSDAILRDLWRIRVLVAVTLAAILLFTAGAIYYMFNSNIILSFEDIYRTTRVICVLLLCGLIAFSIKVYIRNDISLIARYLRHIAGGLQLMVLASMLFVPLFYVSTVFMYAASATQRPLMDAQLATLDATIGFDWLSFLELANSNYMLAGILVFSYHALGPQVPLVGSFFCITLQARKLFEFLALFAVSLLLSCAIMALVPAEGAYAYFQPELEIRSNFTSLAGMWHFNDLELLRSGEPFLFSQAKVQGLVTFPSFHTALGILVVYVLRGAPLLLIPVAVLNALMIIATLPEGGHHLSDVLAGLIVAVLAIAMVSRGVRSAKQLRRPSSA